MKHSDFLQIYWVVPLFCHINTLIVHLWLSVLNLKKIFRSTHKRRRGAQQWSEIPQMGWSKNLYENKSKRFQINKIPCRLNKETCCTKYTLIRDHSENFLWGVRNLNSNINLTTPVTLGKKMIVVFIQSIWFSFWITL